MEMQNARRYEQQRTTGLQEVDVDELLMILKREFPCNYWVRVYGKDFSCRVSNVSSHR